MTPGAAGRPAEFCEVCGRYLVSRRARARRRCAIHVAQHALFPPPVTSSPARRRTAAGGEKP